MAAFSPASADLEFMVTNDRRQIMGSVAKWFKKSMVVAAAAAMGLVSNGYAQTKPEKFKIGGVLSLSGPYGLLGEDMR
jgi:hypothetical protein